MDSQLANTFVSGVFSVITTFGAIWLKDRLDRRAKDTNRTETTPPPPEPTAKAKPVPSTSVSMPAPLSPPAAAPAPVHIPAPATAKASARSGRSAVAFDTVGLALVSALLGYVMVWAGEHAAGTGMKWGALTVGVLILALDIGLLIKHRDRSTPFAFQLDNAVLWVAVIFGYSLREPSHYTSFAAEAQSTLGILLPWLAGSALIGGVALRPFRKKRHDT